MAKKGGPFGMKGYKGAGGAIKMGRLPAAVRYASTGEFVVDSGAIAVAQSWATGTTYSWGAFGSATSAMLYSKLWFKVWLYSVGTKLPLQVAVIKTPAGVAATSYDISDNATLNKLRTEGRLFYHNWHYVPCCPATSNIMPKPFEFEFRNVKLEEDEGLALVWRTLAAVTDGVRWPVAKYAATDL